MKLFEKVFKRWINSTHIVLLIFIIAVTSINGGCSRKVGVKPGGQAKTDTSKCKCKKHKSIYSVISSQKSMYFNSESSSRILTKA